jgi:hypothetical protein
MLALKDLQQNLKEYNVSIFEVPLVMQFNKRDLTDANITLMPMEKMQHDLNRQLKVPTIPGSALKGDGVGKTINACLKLVLKALQKELNLGG